MTVRLEDLQACFQGVIPATMATADAQGELRLRTPYGAGSMLPVRATSCELSIEGHEPLALTVTDEDVETGGTIVVHPS